MELDQWIDRFNELSKPTADQKRPIKPEELLGFLRNRNRQRTDLTAFVEAIQPIVRTFSSESLETRQVISASLSRDTSRYLLGYAQQMAQDAVRKTSPELVRLGLIALAMDGGSDVRDAIIRMALLYHSAAKLGMETQTVFEEVSALAVAESVTQAMRSFPTRPPLARDIGDAFRYREAVTEDGFIYQQIDR